MEWMDESGINIEESSGTGGLALYINCPTINTYGTENGTTRFNLRNSDTQMFAWFVWNTTTYPDCYDAWTNGALTIRIAINFDEVNTSFNVWNIIGMLLFFQMPDVHWVLNIIIAIPLWLSVGYLIFIFIVKIIPFIG